MFGTAVSRIALLRNARNGVTGKDVTAHSAAVGQELTVCYHNYVQGTFHMTLA